MEKRGRKSKVIWSDYVGRSKVFNWRELGYSSLSSFRVSLSTAKKQGKISGYKTKLKNEDELLVEVK